jgi:signal transduction histidine kinase
MRIRNKLIVAFSVPLSILLVTAAVEVSSSINQVSAVNRQGSLATAAVGPGGIIQALQNEREDAVLTLLSDSTAAPAGLGLGSNLKSLYPQNDPVLTNTTNAIRAFQTAVDSEGSAAVPGFRTALNSVGQLGAIRSSWTSSGMAESNLSALQNAVETVYQEYTTMVDAFVNTTPQVEQEMTDAQLRTGVDTLDIGQRVDESAWATVQDLINQGLGLPSAVNQAATDLGAVQGYWEIIQSRNSGAYAKVASDSGMANIVSSLALGVQTAEQGGKPLLFSVLNSFTSSTQTANGTTTSALSNVQKQLGLIVTDRVNALHKEANQKALEISLLAVLGTLLSFGVLIKMSSTISRPLVDLARRAEVIAHEHLPRTVAQILESPAGTIIDAPELNLVVEGRDEVADVARALGAVNKSAVDLAASQAVLRRTIADAFVNLGRRNQNLVTRQLDYISEIEQKEDDPAALEELFRLDHLATRMRRNAESLLVLAGNGPARQWSSSVSAVDVVRAASAEVEDYQRLRLRHFDHAVITGAATTDLAHILAELMENGLAFSPPHTSVELFGRALDDSYVISIVDSGIGMSKDELDTANRRLAGSDSFNDLPGRYLGHYVAGRLAARHEIGISLQESETGGIVARIKVPSTAVESSVADPSVTGSSAGEPEVVSAADTVPAEWTSAVEAETVPAAWADQPAAPTFEAEAATEAADFEPESVVEDNWTVAESAEPAIEDLAIEPPAAPVLGPEPAVELPLQEPVARAVPDLAYEEIAPAVAETPAPAVAAASEPVAAEAPRPVADQPPTTPSGMPRLTRRVPGASLPEADESLRRTTPTRTTRNATGLTAALTQYLSAASGDSSGSRPAKEQDR